MINHGTNVKICDTVLREPVLASLLRDVNRHPAQVEEGSDEWKVMVLIVCAFKLGQDSVVEDEGKNN